MPKFPRISGKEIIRAIEKLNFILVRQKSNHVIMVKFSESGKTGCAVPLHKILAVGALSGI
ncbi:MAG: addiction module toxin, HicA family [Bacteroidetes bacterium]|nr:MAG: addiction module toxin, HicA family [Bacteroidota bacterium]